MSLNASKLPQKSSFPKQEALEAGGYPAALVQIIDLGVQPQRAFKGEDKPDIQTVLTTYELADEFILDENGEEDKSKPRWVQEELPFYSLEADLAKSTKRYLALDPEKEFEGDWTQLIGKPATVTLTRSASKKNVGSYNNYIHITTPMRRKEQENMPGLVNEPKVFSLSDPDMTVFKSLPEWLQTKIKENKDFEGSKLEALLDGAPAPSKETSDEESTPSTNEAQEDTNNDDW